MVLTKPQFNCLRDICHSRKGVYLQEKKFGITTYAALLTRRLIDVDMTRGNEGMVLKNDYSVLVYKLNTSIHATGKSYQQILSALRRK